jgi:hypothetical protein
MGIAARDLVSKMARITALPEPTINQPKRRLIEARLIPASCGANIAELETEHAVLLLLAVLADVPAKDAASTAIHYFHMHDDEGNKLGDTLTNLLNRFKSPCVEAALAYRTRLEIDCGYPRALLSIETTSGQHEVYFGVQNRPWSDIKVRKATTISGKCLFEIGAALHGWPE